MVPASLTDSFGPDLLEAFVAKRSLFVAHSLGVHAANTYIVTPLRQAGSAGAEGNNLMFAIGWDHQHGGRLFLALNSLVSLSANRPM